MATANPTNKSTFHKDSDSMAKKCCPFCHEEAGLNMMEHGKKCPVYQDTISKNICHFCSPEIDECSIEQHDQYRSVMEKNSCPFCAEETTDDLYEHGKHCFEYKDSLAMKDCPFCSSPIEGCFVEQHWNFRNMMENPDEIERILEDHFNCDEMSDSEDSADDIGLEEDDFNNNSTLESEKLSQSNVSTEDFDLAST